MGATDIQSGTQAVLKSLENGHFDPEVLRDAILLRGDDQTALFALARARRAEAFPAGEVEVRSVIEVSNICVQQCNFCNIGKGDSSEPYTIDHDVFVELTDFVYEKGRRVLLMQSGENPIQGFVDHVTHCIKSIKQKYPDLVLILCFGNLKREQYQQLRDAGGERYILKFEASNAELYHELKPRDDLERRLESLRDLIDIGFGVGSGNIVGLPGQTMDDLVSDLQLAHRLDLTMVSCTAFIPGEESKYASEPIGDLDLTLNTLAILRIMDPSRLIPTTSSLEKAREGGQYLGLMAGANTVTIHDGTPEELRKLFPIYSTKRFAPRAQYLYGVVEKAEMKLAKEPLK